MLILIVDRTIRPDNGGCLSSDNCGNGHLSKVTSSKLKKLIHPVHIQIVVCLLHSDSSGILRSDNGGTGRVSKVTSSKLRKSCNLC